MQRNESEPIAETELSRAPERGTGYFTLFGSRGGADAPPWLRQGGGILKSRTGIPIFYK